MSNEYYYYSWLAFVLKSIYPFLFFAAYNCFFLQTIIHSAFINIFLPEILFDLEMTSGNNIYNPKISFILQKYNITTPEYLKAANLVHQTTDLQL